MKMKVCESDEKEDLVIDYHFSIEQEKKRINNNFKNNFVREGLKELKILFLRNQDRISADEVDVLISKIKGNLSDRISGVLSPEVFRLKEDEIRNEATKLLKNYEGYIAKVRRHAQKDKEFNADFLALSDVLDKKQCKKYLRTFVENGFTYKKFWLINRKDLVNLGIIPTGDIDKIIEATIEEKHKIFHNVLIVAAFFFFFGITFLGVTNLNYFNFEWTGLKNGVELNEPLFSKFGDFGFDKLSFLSASFFDRAVGIALIMVTALITVMFVTIKQISQGGAYASLLMLLLYLIIIPAFFLLSLHTVFLYLSFIPILIINYNLLQETIPDLSFFNYMFNVLKIAFLLRLILFTFFLVFLPTVYDNFIRKL